MRLLSAVAVTTLIFPEAAGARVPQFGTSRFGVARFDCADGTCPKATPVIVWAKPAAIAQGTALSAAQLNASAGMPGTFTYAPAIGSVLTAGTGLTLTVTFAPTDAINYTTSATTVTINVTSGANPPSFTDDPLVVGATNVKAIHLAELRQSIDSLRTRYAVDAYSWTDATIVPGVTNVQAIHVTQMQAALAEVYVFVGRIVPPFSPITPEASLIRTWHISELRQAVIGLW